MAVPGKAGVGLLGDESLEFWRGPLQYVEKRRKQYGEVFLGRLLNKPTIFVTGSSSIRELLVDQWDCFSMGYREFMFELFDENLLFLDGDSWKEARASLEQVFDHSNLSQSMETCKQLISDHIQGTLLHTNIQAYHHFKGLSTQLSIKLFLSHLISSDEAREISELMTTHWHGIISVPLSINLSWLRWKSGYGKALTSKERLLEIIHTKLQTQPSEIASHSVQSCSSVDLTSRNILLFVSALIPKGLASIMTSLLLELSKPENRRYHECINDESLMEDIILEVQRLWPPFLGGRRICTKTCEISGYTIPDGHAVAYMSYNANRDPSIFTDPNTFRPERWRDENSSHRELVWTFGGGPRVCIGKHLVTTILKEWLSQLLSTLQWTVSEYEGLQYKLLPVCRPTDDVQAMFTPLNNTCNNEPSNNESSNI